MSPTSYYRCTTECKQAKIELEVAIETLIGHRRRIRIPSGLGRKPAVAADEPRAGIATLISENKAPELENGR